MKFSARLFLFLQLIYSLLLCSAHIIYQPAMCHDNRFLFLMGPLLKALGHCWWEVKFSLHHMNPLTSCCKQTLIRSGRGHIHPYGTFFFPNMDVTVSSFNHVISKKNSMAIIWFKLEFKRFFLTCHVNNVQYVSDTFCWLIYMNALIDGLIPCPLQYTNYEYGEFYDYNEGGATTDAPPTEGAKTEVPLLLIQLSWLLPWLTHLCDCPSVVVSLLPFCCPLIYWFPQVFPYVIDHYDVFIIYPVSNR